MNIQTVIRTLGLLKEANCEDYVPLAELARELKTSKTELMAFIKEHQPLFVIARPDAVRGRNPGLLVFDAFDYPEKNYTRPEFLARLQKENEKTVHVSAYSGYGEVFGHFVAEDRKSDTNFPDDADHRRNHHLWRNTAEKLARLDATGHARRGYFWDLTEGRTRIWYDHTVTAEDLRTLQAEGWKLTGELPEL